MRKLLLLLLLTSWHSIGQIQMTATKTGLHKREGQHQALMATDTANSQIVAYLADKEQVKVLRYNRAVFFKDSLVTKRPASEFLAMEGYSFDGNKAAVYWRDEYLKKIEGIYFDFETKAVTKRQFKFTYGTNEDRMFTFSENNSFHLLTLLPNGKLRFSIFNGTGYIDKVADFSSFHIVGADNKKTSLNYLIKQYGLQKVETKTFNSLVDAGNKIKFYVLPDKMLLTLDNNREFTQVFTIDPNTFEVSSKSIPQTGYEKGADTNSFYLNGRLYRILLTKNQIRLSAVSIETGEELKSYTAGKKDAITFKNSPLYTERGIGAPASELESTEKFLRKANGEGAALSVYRTPDDLLITAGSARTIKPAENIVIGMIASGSDLGDVEDIRTTYFESLFDESFEHRPDSPKPLAIDYIGAFKQNNKKLAYLYTIIPFKEYYILGYYNKISQCFVLEKYEDVKHLD